MSEASRQAHIHGFCRFLNLRRKAPDLTPGQPPDQTPNQLLKEGNLLPGDICTWVEYGHTNVYAGDGLWYDAGRNGNLGGYKSGTFYFKTFGPAATVNMSGTTVGYIIRLIK